MTRQTSIVVPFAEPVNAAVYNGTVLTVREDMYSVDISGALQTARTAFSCLVQPMPGDRVMCTRCETGDCYILGIIERPGKQQMTLSFSEDALVQTKNGALSIASGKSITLAANESLTCFSDQAIYKSRAAVVDCKDIIAFGEKFQASFKTVSIVSRMISTMAKYAVEKFTGFVRHTEGSDQVNAGQMTRKSEGLYSMDSKYTVMVSKKDTKIDGERIHMG